MASISVEDKEAAEVELEAAERALLNAIDRLGGKVKKSRGGPANPLRKVRSGLETALEAVQTERAELADLLDA